MARFFRRFFLAPPFFSLLFRERKRSISLRLLIRLLLFFDLGFWRPPVPRARSHKGNRTRSRKSREKRRVGLLLLVFRAKFMGAFYYYSRRLIALVILPFFSLRKSLFYRSLSEFLDLLLSLEMTLVNQLLFKRWWKFSCGGFLFGRRHVDCRKRLNRTSKDVILQFRPFPK